MAYAGNEVNIRYDTSNTGELTDAELVVVSVHELGHAYGLSDQSSSCRVMNIGQALGFCTSFPALDDRTGVDAIY